VLSGSATGEIEIAGNQLAAVQTKTADLTIEIWHNIGHA
jgi:hypothetical protein